MYPAAALVMGDLVLRTRRPPASAMDVEDGAGPEAAADPATPAGNRVFGALAAASAVGLLASFVMHLLNLRMQALGFSMATISWSVALQAISICVSALVARRIIARVGLRATLTAAALVCAGSLLTLALSAELSVLNVFRLVFGSGLVFLLIAAEFLVTARCDPANRAYLVASFSSVIGLGAIGAPLLLGHLDVQGMSPFIAAGAMLLIAAKLLQQQLSPRDGQTDRPSSLAGVFFYMPAAFCAGLVFGIADNGGLSLLPTYGILHGFDLAEATALAACAALGACACQFPIASLAEKRGHREALLSMATAAIFLVSALPIVLGTKILAYCVAFGLGAVLEGLYTIALMRISEDRRSRSLSSVNACFVCVCSLGEVVGPSVGAVSMDTFGPNGLTLPLLCAFAAYILIVVFWKPTAGESRKQPNRQSTLTIIEQKGAA